MNIQWFIIANLIFDATLYIDIATDYKRWLSGIGINHNRGAALRMVGLTASATAFGCGAFYCVLWWQTTLLCLAFLFFLCSVYLMNFDGLYNNKRRFNWWFTGGGGTGSAKTDQFLKRLTLTQHKILKIGLMVISFALLLFAIEKLTVNGL